MVRARRCWGARRIVPCPAVRRIAATLGWLVVAPLLRACALRPAVFTLRAPSTSCRRPRAPDGGGRKRAALVVGGLAPLGLRGACGPAVFTLRAPSTSCRRPRAPDGGGRNAALAPAGFARRRTCAPRSCQGSVGGLAARPARRVRRLRASGGPAPRVDLGLISVNCPRWNEIRPRSAGVLGDSRLVQPGGPARSRSGRVSVSCLSRARSRQARSSWTQPPRRSWTRRCENARNGWQQTPAAGVAW